MFYLLKIFLEVYSIIRLNIFEETVFNDTTYTICSFQFTNKKDIVIPDNSNQIEALDIYIYPEINNILPKKDQFYDYEKEIPDYDVFCKNALERVKEIADKFHHKGYKNN
mgnify:CR=1 FL=1